MEDDDLQRLRANRLAELKQTHGQVRLYLLVSFHRVLMNDNKVTNN